MNSFKNKIALVTGSTRGIGLSIAMNLQTKGCKVILNSRKNFKHTNKNKFANIFHYRFDCTNERQVFKNLKKIKKDFKKVDYLICNVGSSKVNKKISGSKEEWKRMIENNLYSSIIVIENFLKFFNKEIKIVCISSISGKYLSKSSIEYTVAKSALNTYVRKKSKLLNGDSTINCVAPGNILFKGGSWDKKLKAGNAKVMKQIRENVPLKRFGTPAEVASLVSFICSGSSNFINGSIITIDGGQDQSI